MVEANLSVVQEPKSAGNATSTTDRRTNLSTPPLTGLAAEIALQEILAADRRFRDALGLPNKSDKTATSR